MIALCFCLSVGHVRESCKTSEPIEMPFGGLRRVGSRKHVLDRGQGRTNPFVAARGDKTAMRPFVKTFDHLLL